MPKPLLPNGLYEHVVTRDLAQSLSRLPPTRSHQLQALDGADAHAVLSRHLAAEVARALTSIPANDRPRAQVEIINQLLSSLRALVPADAGESIDDADVALPGDQLLSVYSGSAPERPASPLVPCQQAASLASPGYMP